MINNQWHSTYIEDMGDGKSVFVKHYTPGSFEFNNELFWLRLLNRYSLTTFRVPKILEYSTVDGCIKLELIEYQKASVVIDNFSRYINIALELHSLKRFPDSCVKDNSRNKISRLNIPFGAFLKDSVYRKAIHINSKFSGLIPAYIFDRISLLLQSIEFGGFTIVHRDFLSRHIIINEGLPVLIDWEFSNISDPIHDVAKIIFDQIILTKNSDYSEIIKNTTESYLKDGNQEMIPTLQDKIFLFLYIVVIEYISMYVNGIRGLNIFDINEKIKILENIYSLDRNKNSRFL